MPCMHSLLWFYYYIFWTNLLFGVWPYCFSLCSPFLSVRLGLSHARLVVVIYLSVEPPDEVRGAKARTGATAAEELHGCNKSTGA